MHRPENLKALKRKKKLIFMALTCFLAVWLTISLIGCGSSDKQKAQDHLQAGADQIQKIRNQASEWQNQIISMSGVTDAKSLRNGIEKIKLSAREMSQTVDDAKAEYEKITRLKAVSDYVKYADLRLAQLGVMQDMLNKTNEYFDKRIVVVNSGDLSGLVPVEQQYSNEIASLSDEIQKIENEATRLKKDKKI